MENFYIYRVYRGGELVYVGKGKGDRWKHVTSGKSHNAMLNRLFYEHVLLGKEALNVVREDVGCELEAIREEHRLIFTHKPICNELLKYNEPEDFSWGEDIEKGDVDWKNGIII